MGHYTIKSLREDIGQQLRRFHRSRYCCGNSAWTYSDWSSSSAIDSSSNSVASPPDRSMSPCIHARQTFCCQARVKTVVISKLTAKSSNWLKDLTFRNEFRLQTKRNALVMISNESETSDWDQNPNSKSNKILSPYTLAREYHNHFVRGPPKSAWDSSYWREVGSHHIRCYKQSWRISKFNMAMLTPWPLPIQEVKSSEEPRGDLDRAWAIRKDSGEYILDRRRSLLE
jgi:hypothetical protein